MADIQAPQAAVVATFSATAEGVRAPQAAVLVPYNVPAVGLRATFGAVSVTYRQTANMRTTQGVVRAVVSGRASDSHLQA